MNHHNSILKSENVADGEISNYTGDTPTKDSDNKYRYEFISWTFEIATVAEIAIYTAMFKEIPNTYSV